MNAIHIVHEGFKTPTKEAASLKEELIKRGVRVYVEVYDGFKHVDLTLSRAKLNVEVDGIQHLTNPHQIVTDLARGYYSNKLGYNTLHIPNEMIRSHLQEISDALADASKIRSDRISRLWIYLVY